ncbi:hypothetical protein L1987_84708 [Smallanthus sonchifolius]|uniref:Uncharacterized protein n=1 Tax=Smallanthus sonchifolius TaxID=185202 RepID=A0ACB8XW43_9ASTR|nr:hypothetical protein L1987_84708 [Smallanthus sonchifolius]
MASPVAVNDDDSNTESEEESTALHIYHKRARRVSFTDNTSVHISNRHEDSGTPLSPNPPSDNLASTKDETGLLRFTQTPDCSDMKFTATRVGQDERPILESNADVFASVEKASESNTKDGPPRGGHLKRKVAPSPRSTSRFEVDDSVVGSLGVKIGGPSKQVEDGSTPERLLKKKVASPSKPEAGSCSPRDKSPLVSYSEASKPNSIPDIDPLCASKIYRPQWSIKNGSRMNDPEEIRRRWLVSENTVEEQKKLLKSYKDKLSRVDAHIRELETEVVSLNERLVSNEKEHMELIQHALEVQVLNTKEDRLNDTLKDNDEQFSAKEAAWTSEKNALMSTVESLRKQIQQLEGEKFTVADDRIHRLSHHITAQST